MSIVRNRESQWIFSIMIGIYKITSPSGRVYIGQSRCIEKRFLEYKRHKYKRQTRLNVSIERYGLEAHKFEVIEECKFELLNERERYWQDYYEVLGRNGLNCCLTNTSKKPFIVSKETKEKISKSRKGKRSGCHHQNYGKKLSEETRRKMREYYLDPKNKPDLSGKRNPFFGKKHSQETKEKIGNANRAEKSPFFGKTGVNCHNYGRKHTLESIIKRKMFGSNNHFYGKKHTEESKLKISLSKKGSQALSKNPKAKKVINVHTKKIYSCIKELSLEQGINYDTMRHRVHSGKWGYVFLQSS